MNEILINAMTILVLLAGLAALVVWARGDNFTRVPRSAPRRRVPEAGAREGRPDAPRPADRTSPQRLVRVSQQ